MTCAQRESESTREGETNKRFHVQARHTLRPNERAAVLWFTARCTDTRALNPESPAFVCPDVVGYVDLNDRDFFRPLRLVACLGFQLVDDFRTFHALVVPEVVLVAKKTPGAQRLRTTVLCESPLCCENMVSDRQATFPDIDLMFSR